MNPKVISIRPEVAEATQVDDMYSKVCSSRLDKLEKTDGEQDVLIREIHAKIHNGFGDKINSTNERVTELKKDSTKMVDDLKKEMDKRFDTTDRGLKHLNRTAVALLITLLTSALGVVVVLVLGG